MTNHEFDIGFYCFLSGAGLSWLATYLSLTRERRAIAEIRRLLEFLADRHDLTNPQRRQLKEAANDSQIWRDYVDARQVTRGSKMSPGYRIDSTLLAAYKILCVDVLGLTFVHVVQVLLRTEYAHEYKKNLADVIAEIGDQKSPPPARLKSSRSLLWRSIRIRVIKVFGLANLEDGDLWNEYCRHPSRFK